MTFKSTIIELEAVFRDFIIEMVGYVVTEECAQRLKNARVDAEGFIRCRVDEWDLEQMIGNLCLEGNHTDDPSLQEMAYHVSDLLETNLARLQRQS